MDVTVMELLIGFFGTVMVGLFIILMRGFRSELREIHVEQRDTRVELRTMSTKLVDMEKTFNGRLVGMEKTFNERFTGMEKSLVRIEATQVEHGKQLDRMADQGERIAVLEGAVGIGVGAVGISA